MFSTHLSTREREMRHANDTRHDGNFRDSGVSPLRPPVLLLPRPPPPPFRVSSNPRRSLSSLSVCLRRARDSFFFVAVRTARERRVVTQVSPSQSNRSGAVEKKEDERLTYSLYNKEGKRRGLYFSCSR